MFVHRLKIFLREPLKLETLAKCLICQEWRSQGLAATSFYPYHQANQLVQLIPLSTKWLQLTQECMFLSNSLLISYYTWMFFVNHKDFVMWKYCVVADEFRWDEIMLILSPLSQYCVLFILKTARVDWTGFLFLISGSSHYFGSK